MLSYPNSYNDIKMIYLKQKLFNFSTSVKCKFLILQLFNMHACSSTTGHLSSRLKPFHKKYLGFSTKDKTLEQTLWNLSNSILKFSFLIIPFQIFFKSINEKKN